MKSEHPCALSRAIRTLPSFVENLPAIFLPTLDDSGPCTRGAPPSLCSSAPICLLRGDPLPQFTVPVVPTFPDPAEIYPAEALCPRFLSSSNAFPSPHPRWICGGSPAGPAVKTLPRDAGDLGSILGQGTKISHATEQLRRAQASTKDPTCHS